MRADDCYFNPTVGDGIDTFEDYEFADEPALIVNTPLPNRWAIPCTGGAQIIPNSWVMVEREDGTADLRQVHRVNRHHTGTNILELTQKMTGWPKIGGVVTLVLGYSTTYINARLTDRIHKLGLAQFMMEREQEKNKCLQNLLKNS